MPADEPGQRRFFLSLQAGQWLPCAPKATGKQKNERADKLDQPPVIVVQPSLARAHHGGAGFPDGKRGHMMRQQIAVAPVPVVQPLQ